MFYILVGGINLIPQLS